MPGRRDLAVAVGAALVSMVVVGWLGRATWFYADAWDFLLDRDLGDPLSLMRPHHGHLQFPVSAVHQILYESVGLDFWPWYFLPRLLGFGGMAVILWIVLRRRGADPLIAWATLAVLLVLGSSAFLTAATIGHHFVLPLLALGGAMLQGGGPHGVGDKVLLAAILAGMLISTSLGVAAVAGLAVASLLAGNIRATAPSFLVAGVPYAVWYLSFPREGGGALELTAGRLLAVPADVWSLLQPIGASILGLPAGFGAPILLALLGVSLWWLTTHRLPVFDMAWLATALAYMVMVSALRVSTGRAEAETARYTYMLILLLMVVVVPKLRMPDRGTTRVAAVVAIGAVVAAGNLGSLAVAFDDWNEAAATLRLRAEAAGALVAAGEPAMPGANLDIMHGRDLRVSGIREFLGKGWRPGLPEDDAVVAEARGYIRFVNAVRAADDLEDCTRSTPAAPVSFDTHTTDPRFALRGREVGVELHTTDGFGDSVRAFVVRGGRTIHYPEGLEGVVEVRVVDPAGVLVCLPDR